MAGTPLRRQLDPQGASEDATDAEEGVAEFGMAADMTGLVTCFKCRHTDESCSGRSACAQRCFLNDESCVEVSFVIGSVGLARASQDLVERCLSLRSPVQSNERCRAPGVGQYWKRDLEVLARKIAGSIQMFKSLLGPALHPATVASNLVCQRRRWVCGLLGSGRDAWT